MKDLEFNESQRKVDAKAKTKADLGEVLREVTKPKEKPKQEFKQEIEKLAELLMQSENLDASVIMLNDFADKCWQEGALDAQNDAAKEIREHYVAGK